MFMNMVMCGFVCMCVCLCVHVLLGVPVCMHEHVYDVCMRMCARMCWWSHSKEILLQFSSLNRGMVNVSLVTLNRTIIP